MQESIAAGHRLAVTRRCLEEDLHLSPDVDWRGEVGHQEILRAFQAERSGQPLGREPIAELMGVVAVQAFGLNAGDAYGATWYDDQDVDVVWLLGVDVHADYYELVRLGRRGRLLPTADDYEQFEPEPSTGAFVGMVLDEVDRLVEQAAKQRNELIEGLLAERIPVRICWETGSPEYLVVAVSEQLLPGPIILPKKSQLSVAAAFFAGVTIDQFLPFPQGFDNTEVRDDELAFRYFAPPR